MHPSQQQEEQLVSGAPASPQKKDESAFQNKISLSTVNKILIAIVIVVFIIFIAFSPKHKQKSAIPHSVKGLKKQPAETSSIQVQKQKQNDELIPAQNKLQKQQNQQVMNQNYKSSKTIQKNQNSILFLPNSKQNKLSKDIKLNNQIEILKNLIDPDPYNQDNMQPQIIVQKQKQLKVNKVEEKVNPSIQKGKQIDYGEKIKKKYEQQRIRHEELKKYQQQKKKQDQLKKKQEQEKKQMQAKKVTQQKERQKRQQDKKRKLQQEQKRAQKQEQQKRRHQLDKKKQQVNKKLSQNIKINNQQIKKDNKDALAISKSSSKNQLSIDMAQPLKISDYIVPQFLWTYVDGIEQQSFFIRRCLQNMKYYSRQSKFQLKIINYTNYNAYLSHQTNLIIDKALNILEQRMKKEPLSNLKDHYQKIRRRLIMFHILNEKGGIFVESNVLFTQNFDWLKDINYNKYINKGSMYSRAKYVGFFDIDHGTELKKFNKMGFKYETQKYMIQFPCFQPYFFSAVAKGEYLTTLLNEYIDLLTHPQSLQQKLSRYNLVMGALHGKDLYYQIFYISQHLALKKKQMEIDAAGNLHGNDFAIDFFGLFTINERYFPKKLQFTFENTHQQKLYWNLAKYTLEQLEQTSGPLSYIVCMIFQNYMSNRLQNAYNNHIKQEIHPQSFLSKYVIMNTTQPFIQRQLQINKINSEGKPWEKLPKIIWIFWDTGIKNMPLENKLCIDNIKKYAKVSKFEIKQLNNSNIQQYIGKQLNNKIDKFIQNKKIATYVQTKSEFIRIAIMAKYGGIYMDASYFALEKFDWIINISRYPSRYIFNRYGQLPSVFMLFHPHFGQPFSWRFDKQANTKNMWLTAYQNSLLIAQPNQQIFWDWFQQFGRFITSTYQQSENIMRQYEVYGQRWTQKDNAYLAAMDSIKNVIGKKQKQIRQKMMDKDYKGPKSAAEYYRIWSMSGYRGQQKFRAHTNFDNTYYSKPFNSDNLFLWRYSEEYVSGIIGKVNNIAKLQESNIQYLNAVLLKSYDSKFNSEFHPYSFFMKYLYNTTIQKINKVDNHLQIQYIKQ